MPGFAILLKTVPIFQGGIIVVLLLAGLLTFVFGIGYDVIFPTSKSAAYKLGLSILFLVVLFPLALVWDYWIQKTGSMMGSIISQVGVDLLILNGFIAFLNGEVNANQSA